MQIRTSLFAIALTVLVVGCGGEDEAEVEMEVEVDTVEGLMDGMAGDTMMPDSMHGMPEEMMEDTTGGTPGGR